jgi:hypothetical protein
LYNAKAGQFIVWAGDFVARKNKKSPNHRTTRRNCLIFRRGNIYLADCLRFGPIFAVRRSALLGCARIDHNAKKINKKSFLFGY